MATPYAIKIAPSDTGLWHFNQSESAANKATELLQKDMETHHVYFNQDGFHNHISHHLLALYGTGASAETLVKGYKNNETYQRPVIKAHSQQLIDELRDWEKAKSRLGKEQYYTDWLHFYQHEITRLGSWQQVLAEYMFKPDDPRSEDMLIRMFAGFLHPLIQLMYGVEWDQPAIVAMALAQASVHSAQFKEFMLGAEARSRSAETPMPRIVDLLRDAAADEKLRGSPRLDDGNKVRDGVLARAPDEALRLTSRVRVLPSELEERTAEMYNTAIFVASSAALHSPAKDPKYEFFLIHHVNVAPIFVTLNKQPWIPLEAKVRLLEWKIRMDLVQYSARGSPVLDVQRIRDYVPKTEDPSPAVELLPRMHALAEDGHAIKLFRAIGIGKEVSKKYEDSDFIVIKGDLWNQIAHLVVDSVEAPGPTWVRNAGFDEAWDEVQDRAKVGKGVL